MHRFLAPALLAGALLCLLLPQLAQAKERGRTLRKPALDAPSFVPGAGAPAGMDAPLLSGIDYTDIAPAQARIRVVEDEPYVTLRGYDSGQRLCVMGAQTRIALRADVSPESCYSAEVNLRCSADGWEDLLRHSFDSAADYAYRRAIAHPTIHNETAFAVCEVRSPLCLTAPGRDAHREYLAYTAAVTSPLYLSEDLATVYQFTKGELKVVRAAGGRLYMLTVAFESHDFAHSITLSENIARCVLSRVIDGGYGLALPLLSYEKEYSFPLLEDYEMHPAHPRVPDLLEQPDEPGALFPPRHEAKEPPLTPMVIPALPESIFAGPAAPRSMSLLPKERADFGMRLLLIGLKIEDAAAMIVTLRQPELQALAHSPVEAR